MVDRSCSPPPIGCLSRSGAGDPLHQTSFRLVSPAPETFPAGSSVSPPDPDGRWQLTLRCGNSDCVGAAGEVVGTLGWLACSSGHRAPDAAGVVVDFRWERSGQRRLVVAARRRGRRSHAPRCAVYWRGLGAGCFGLRRNHFVFAGHEFSVPHVEIRLDRKQLRQLILARPCFRALGDANGIAAAQKHARARPLSPPTDSLFSLG